MSTIIQTHYQPMSLYFTNAPSSGGILLNGAAGPSRNRHSLPAHDKYATSKSLPPPGSDRKIRFAPLPDPRKCSTLDDEDKLSPTQGTLPLPSLLYANPNQPSTRSLPDPAHSSSNQTDDTDRDDASSTGGGGGSLTLRAGPSNTQPRRKNTKAFLKNLLSVNSSPISIQLSKDSSSALGVSLRRSGSRDSNGSSENDGSSNGGDCGRGRSPTSPHAKRKRSSSTGPTPSSANNNNGSSSSPFSKTGKVKRPSTSAGTTTPTNLSVPPSPRTKAQPLRPTISAPSSSVPTDSPIKMLNGRVYGARAQQRQGDWSEPEFVEWGYGGMGSVKSGEAFYGGVQGAEDDFEASGMGWVKKRKEERAKKEREAKEREERERREAEVQRDVERRHEGAHAHTHAHEKETSNPNPKATLPKIVVHSSETEHVCRTVSVPHHHHSRHPSRTNSIASSGSIPTLSSLGSTIKKSPLSTSYTHTHTPAGERPEFVSGSSSSETASASGSGSASVSTSSEVEEEVERDVEGEGEGEGSSVRGEDEDDEEDVEEELRDEARMTSLCAGNEKISRHRD